ncbi:GtrA family protein [Nonomuraea dietziae]|uniref:GtrA family protein n=1 Tax=Nonomuraea dietziae TaxID=65515 RepID=UPI0031CE5475
MKTAVKTRLVEVVVPVHNEQRALRASIERLHGYLAGSFPYGFRITIADNASSDTTWQIAQELCRVPPGGERRPPGGEGAGTGAAAGCGRPARPTWSATWTSTCPPTSTPSSPLVAPLLSGHSDLAIGTRLVRTANVVRGPKREFLSRTYNLLLRGVMGAGFSDAQCGFKAARTEIAQALLPLSRTRSGSSTPSCCSWPSGTACASTRWPVDWVDDLGQQGRHRQDGRRRLRVHGPGWPARRCRARPTCPCPRASSRRGCPRAWRGSCPASWSSGIVSTLSYLLLYSLLRLVAPAYVANAVALFVTAVANTAANRRFTFGVKGSAGAIRHQVEGLIAFLVGLALTTGGLALLPSGAPHRVELVAVIVANGLATLVRFLLLRVWVFNPDRRSSR